MTRPHLSPAQEQDRAGLPYAFLCYGSLAVILVVLLERGFGLAVLFPVLLGLLGVVTRWGVGPLLLVGALAFVHSPLNAWIWGARLPRGSHWLLDVLLAGAVLGFVAGHCRLRGLVRNLLPVDPRRRWSRLGNPPGALPGLFGVLRQCRSPGAVSWAELALLVAGLSVWAGLAHLGGELLGEPKPPYGMHPRLWRGLVLAWGIGMVVIAGAGLVGYLSRRKMTRDEAALLLQDAWWQETRREQRPVQRWLAWARLRRRRKEHP